MSSAINRVLGLFRAAPSAPSSPLAQAVAPPPLPQDRVELASARPQQLRLPDGAVVAMPGEGRELRLGRDAASDLVVKDEGVSRKHATIRCLDDRLWVQDTSTNGTLVNGARIEKNLWTPLPAGATVNLANCYAIRLEDAAPPPRAPRVAGTLPDGRTFYLTTLPNGNVKVTKCDLTVDASKFDPEKIGCLEENAVTRLKTPADLVEGKRYFLDFAGRPMVGEFVETTPDGRLSFGRTNEYTPREWDTYVNAQQARIDKERRAEQAKLLRRTTGAADLKASEMARLGLTEADLQNPQAVASRIVAYNGELGFDGTSIYPASVEDAAVSLKRAQLAADSSVASRGLVDVQLQKWIAGQKGEALLWRGLKGAYQPENPGVHYSYDAGCAIGAYACGKDGAEASVIGLRIPSSDLIRYYREVGSVPGRNPYAEVYEVDARKLEAGRRPTVLLSSTQPSQKWVFEAFERNGQIKDHDAGLADYQSLCAQVLGEKS